MGYYYKAYKKDEKSGAKAKRVYKVLGPCLLAVASVLLIFSILGFTEVLPDIVGVMCISFTIAPTCFGLTYTILGWNRKPLVAYIHSSGDYCEAPDSPTVEPSAVSVENSTTNCPHCGAVNNSDSSFCRKCSKPLNLTAIRPDCNANSDSDSEYCPKYGHAILDKTEEARATGEHAKFDKAKELYDKGKYTEAAKLIKILDKAKELYNRGEYTEAVKLFKILAEQGNAGGQNGLGACYNNGQGVPQNQYEAVKWFKKAADQGYAQAYYNLGVSYVKGQGVPSNLSEAVIWFKMAAQQGMPEAKEVLRKLGYNEKGEAVNNLTQALENMHQAVSQLQKIDFNPVSEVKRLTQRAEQGDAEAQYLLGHHYHLGEGVEQSYTEAFKWYMEAAKQGHKFAMYRVADCYLDGEGVEQSYTEAFKWYKKAKGTD